MAQALRNFRAFGWAAVLVAGIGYSAMAADFDGRWTGGGSTATRGCATSVAVELAIADGKTTGTLNYGGRQVPAVGVVEPDGAYKGNNGAMKGRFAGGEFAGELVGGTGCAYNVRLKKN